MTPQRRLERYKSSLMGVLMAAPAVVLLFLFLVWPIFVAADYSFTDATGYGGKNYIGSENYLQLLSDQRFHASLLRSLVFSGIALVGSMSVGFVLAYVLYLRIRWWRSFQVMLMIPFVTPVVVVGLLWRIMLEPNNGLVNQSLEVVGLGAFTGTWLTSQATSLVTVSLVQTWTLIPLAMLLIFGSMVALPSDVLEAAEIDGAGHLQRMALIVWPMLKSTIVLVSVLVVLDTFRTFDLVWLLTEGGPIGSSTIATLHIFIVGFVNANYGYANAVGMAVGLLIVLAGLGVRRYQKSQRLKQSRERQEA